MGEDRTGSARGGGSGVRTAGFSLKSWTASEVGVGVWGEGGATRRGGSCTESTSKVSNSDSQPDITIPSTPPTSAHLRLQDVVTHSLTHTLVSISAKDRRDRVDSGLPFSSEQLGIYVKSPGATHFVDQVIQTYTLNSPQPNLPTSDPGRFSLVSSAKDRECEQDVPEGEERPEF